MVSDGLCSVAVLVRDGRQDSSQSSSSFLSATELPSFSKVLWQASPSPFSSLPALQQSKVKVRKSRVCSKAKRPTGHQSPVSVARSNKAHYCYSWMNDWSMPKYPTHPLPPPLPPPPQAFCPHSLTVCCLNIGHQLTLKLTRSVC